MMTYELTAVYVLAAFALGMAAGAICLMIRWH